MDQGSGTLIPVDDVSDTIQRSLSLLGNSVNYISQSKKKGLGKVMRKVCQSDIGNTGKELFGEKFRKTVKSKADSMVAFGKLANRVKQNTRTSLFMRVPPPAGTPLKDTQYKVVTSIFPTLLL